MTLGSKRGSSGVTELCSAVGFEVGLGVGLKVGLAKRTAGPTFLRG